VIRFKNFAVVLVLILASHTVQGANYTLDPTHSFVEWRVQHLGYSWLYGRFNDISGTMTWDAERPENSRINVTIKIHSLDSNHVERDKHLRGKKYLHADKFPKAVFRSTEYRGDGAGGELVGDLTLNGITKTIVLNVKKLGEGKDPWGGYRVGFEASYLLNKSDWGFDYPLGPESDTVELQLGVEGIRRNKHVKR